jgi:hypothetical protein
MNTVPTGSGSGSATLLFRVSYAISIIVSDTTVMKRCL